MAVLHTVGDAASGDKRGRRGGVKGGEANSSCFKIIKMIMEKNFSPVIVFSFSKKECEFYALQMAKLDFNSNEEKKLVGEVFQNAMEVLSEEDRKLPQVEQVLPLLKRGIGIHHGGNEWSLHFFYLIITYKYNFSQVCCQSWRKPWRSFSLKDSLKPYLQLRRLLWVWICLLAPCSSQMPASLTEKKIAG